MIKQINKNKGKGKGWRVSKGCKSMDGFDVMVTLAWNGKVVVCLR